MRASGGGLLAASAGLISGRVLRMWAAALYMPREGPAGLRVREGPGMVCSTVFSAVVQCW